MKEAEKEAEEENGEDTRRKRQENKLQIKLEEDQRRGPKKWCSRNCTPLQDP